MTDDTRRTHLYFGLIAAVLGTAGIVVCAVGAVMSIADGQIIVGLLMMCGLAFSVLVAVEGTQLAHEAHQEGKP